MRVYRGLVSTPRNLNLAGASFSALMGRWRGTARSIMTNASSIVASQAISAVLGAVFWWVAARHYPPASLGFAATAVSAMMLLGALSEVGFGTLIIGELPRFPGRGGPLIMTTLCIVGIVGGMLGLAGAIIAPDVSTGLQPLAGNVGSVTLFGLGVTLMAINLGLDDALIGQLHGEIQLARNTIFAIAKLGLLLAAVLWLADRSGLTMFATWVVGAVASAMGVVVVGQLRGIRVRLYRPQWTLLRGLGRPALGHIGLNLALEAPSLALPIIVAASLSVTVSAYFYIPWMVSALLYAVPGALTLSLFAVVAATPAGMAQKIRFTLGLSIVVAVLANIVLLAGGGMILQFFGSAYAEHASLTLRVLGLAVFPVIVRSHYVAICRIRRQLTVAALAFASGAVLELMLAGLGARVAGLSGVSCGWLVAVCLEAALMAPTVYRAVARPSKA